MRTLEAIDKDLAAVRETLSHTEGTPTEVYSRIVGYYRSVRNWNRGKREEYGERKLYVVDTDVPRETGKGEASRLLLFVRSACPACPSAKAAAGRLGIPVDLVNADTADGMAEAAHHQVYATPTAILVNLDGRELKRAWDSRGIETLAV